MGEREKRKDEYQERIHYEELNNACCSLKTEQRGQKDGWLVGVGEAKQRDFNFVWLLLLVRSQV
jgi:hypothetical protein